MADFFNSLDISASALSAERARMNITSSNLANAQSTRSAEGGPYRRKDAIFEAREVQDFAIELEDQGKIPLHEVHVADVVSDSSPPKMVHNPSHADANEQGYVAMPNINTMEEMVNLMTASRTYESNVRAMNITKNMMDKALEIGRR